MGSLDSISDGIRLENSEGFTVQTSDCENLASLKVKCLVLPILANLENNLVLRKVHLEYLSELLKASLKTP